MKGKRRKLRPLDVWPARPFGAQGARSATVSVPRVFSLIENPNESLEFLVDLRRLYGVSSLRKIRVDYSKCERLDLCASVLLDVLTQRANTQLGFRSGKLEVFGTFSGRPEIDVMLVSSGILKHLGNTLHKQMPKTLSERLRFSDLRIGRPSPPSVTSDIELAASSLSEFFDECLRTENHRLKENWKSNLIQLITEVLDNAEEHASGQKVWYTIGCYNKFDNQADGGECHIVIFNFGESIYESLNRPDTSESLKKQIAALAREHEKRGYFVVVNREVAGWIPMWEEESLWTLYALQEGVSRFSNRPSGIDRGNGTVKMIEFFAELASGNPQMALVSGRTHILFDGTYKLAPVQIGSESRKVIAFNDTNDLRERPDPKYVRTLWDHFPAP